MNHRILLETIHYQCLRLVFGLFACFLLISLPMESLMGQVTGRIESYPHFSSKFVADHRVDVWLPGDYSKDKKYAVLYCQDGQNLFDTLTQIQHREWQMDETAQRVIQEGKAKPFIVVGIWSIAHQRHAEYFPEKAVNNMPPEFRDSLQTLMRTVHPAADLDTLLSDEYLKFFVYELKPFIDSAFSTKKDVKNTFIMGSSSGALLALYAVCEYPGIFGGAACLSTHFTGIFRQENNPFPGEVLEYFKINMPSRRHRLYFDTGDQGLDSLYTHSVAKLMDICKEANRKPHRVLIKSFPGEGHNEYAWSKRLECPLMFLLGQ